MALPKRGCKTGDNHLWASAGTRPPGRHRSTGTWLLGWRRLLGWGVSGSTGASEGSAEALPALHPEHKSAPQNIMGENL